MNRDGQEDIFLKGKKKRNPNAYIFRITALGVITLLLGTVIWLIGYISKSKKASATVESGIKMLSSAPASTPEPGEVPFSVSAAAVPVEASAAAETQAIAVEPIARETAEEEEDNETSSETVKKTKTPKPAKTEKTEKTTQEEEETEKDAAAEDPHAAKSILAGMAETEENTADQEESYIPTPEPEPTPAPEPTAAPTPAYKTLAKHDSSQSVAELQVRLMELGFLDIDEPTDYFGKATENAVRLFQRQHGLTVDGVAGQGTQALLYSGEAQKYCLKIGAEGGDVKMLQQQLCELGYLEEGQIDSVYGETTVAAVKAFQNRNDLSADGFAGEKTLEVLYSDEAKISYTLHKAQKEAEASASAAAKAKKKTATPKPTATPKKDTRKEKFLAAARSKLGCEYILGDCGPKTFDCSGFVYWCLRQAGVSVTRLNAAGFSNKSSWKKITKLEDLEAGDILFYRSDTNSHVNHCGIYIGGGNMIDASSGNGKVIKRPLSAYWKRNFVCARRPW